MANTILPKKSSTPGSVPSAGVLSPGELAINTADQKLYTKNSSGEVVDVVQGLLVASTNYIAQTFGSTQLTTYTKIIDYVISQPGTVKILFDLYIGSTPAAGTAYARIYVNDIAVGIERSNATITPVTYVEDISISSGDHVQIYAYHDLGTKPAKILPFQIGCDGFQGIYRVFD